MELVLIRHGLPKRVVNEDGTAADPPLSTEGKRQAAKMAAWMKGETFDRIYASPMKRAYETAEPLAAAAGLDIQLRPGIAEYDRDSSAYIPVEQLKEEDYESWRAMMQGNYNNEVNFKEFYAAVIDTVEEIISHNRGGKVAVVCHGGVINVWTAHVIGFEPRLFFNPDYTSINRYMAASSGERSVVTLNQAVHLDNR
jgi:probable phosphoglycerate mutase|tara:strand:+ start:10499 stop:11089 length:591 start_codon:yes stop_codon:yes gene_type:complete